MGSNRRFMWWIDDFGDFNLDLMETCNMLLAFRMLKQVCVIEMYVTFRIQLKLVYLK